MFAHIEAETRQVIEKLYGLKDVAAQWERPASADHGDLSSSVALRIAKSVGKKPQEIAGAIADAMMLSPTVERAEVAGPGYVNLHLFPGVLLTELAAAHAACTPKKMRKKEPPVIVDFCGPNIAKPLGAHHLGSHIIGQAIINIYKHAGVHVIGWTYPGDWGTQFGKLAVAFEKWGNGKAPAEHSVEELLALYVRFHEEAERDPSLEDEARAAFKKIEDGDETLRAFWADTVKVTKEALERIYERLHIVIDVETGESFYEDKMEPILREGTAKNIFVKGEGGALVVQFPESMGLPPLMVQKSDGSTLYATRDLAMVRYRIDAYKPSALYYVVDVAQSLHFQQLFATCGMLQWELPVLEHTVFGRMRFKGAAMSTRKGTSLRMEQLLDEAVKRATDIIRERGDAIQTDDPADLAEMMGIGAVAYGILSQNRKMDIVFDWDKMLSFEGNSAPYLQYTHARARSVLRKGGVKKKVIVPGNVDAFEPHERSLLMTLLQFAPVLEEAKRERLPHKLTNYLYQLCQEFNGFYNALPILQAPESQRDLRLALTGMTADVLKSGASILTIRVPDRM